MSFVSINDKTQPAPVKRDLLQWCPTMDLVAVISDTDEITLNRLNGQRVWSTTPSMSTAQSTAAVSLTWRPDGKVLVVGFADGDLQCLNLSDGRANNHLRNTDAKPGSASFLRWVEGKPGVGPSNSFKVKHDVRKLMVELPGIPISSIERMYSNAQNIRTLIHDLEHTTEQMRLLGVGSDTGSFHILVGSFRLDLHALSRQISAKMIEYCSTNYLDMHAFYYRNEAGLSLDLYRLDLFHKGDPRFRDMINNFNDFRAVLGYLIEAMAYIQEEHTSFLEIKAPSFDKFVGSGDGLAPGSLLTFLLTGIPPPELISWVGGLSERLIKKWEKACQTTSLNISKVLVESCLQACKRLVVITMQFRRLFANSKIGKKSDMEIVKVDRILKSIELLMAQLHTLQQALSEEMKLFSAFCQWLSFAIARLSEDDETPDEIMPVSTRHVAQYIREHLQDSKVSSLFSAQEGVNIELFLGLDRPIDTFDPFPDLSDRHAPTMFQTLEILQSASLALFEDTAQDFSEHWQHERTIRLTRAASTSLAARYVHENDQTSLYTVLVEHRDANEDDLIFIIKHPATSGSISICRILIDLSELKSYQISDLKFIDDTEIILLLQGTGDGDRSAHLLAFNYVLLPYDTCSETNNTISECAGPGVVIVPSKHRVLESGVHPISLAINGRKGRRTGLYLQADRQRYTVFDLDDQAEEDIEDENAMSQN